MLKNPQEQLLCHKKLKKEAIKQYHLDHEKQLKIINYTEDSPFSKHEIYLNEHGPINTLEKRLKKIHKLTKEFCKIVEKLSIVSKTLSVELHQSWNVVEEDIIDLEQQVEASFPSNESSQQPAEVETGSYSSKKAKHIVSIEQSFQYLADMINIMSSNSSLLSISIHEIFVKQLEYYQKEYIDPWKKSKTELEHIQSQYVTCLHKYYNKRVFNPNTDEQSHIPRDLQLDKKKKSRRKGTRSFSYYTCLF